MASAIEIGSVVPESLTETRVLDRDAREVGLGSLLRGAGCAVVFVRHFGCVGCGQQIVELIPRLFEIAALAARTLVVGNGDAQLIPRFVARYGLADKPITIVT